jgi:permuted papain-like amidase YaeF/Yiix C92 family enzyme
MERLIAIAVLTVLLQGCATRIELPRADADAAHAAIRFQSSSVVPPVDDALLAPQRLQPGDIVLTSASTLRSGGIRLMTWSSVSHAALYIGEGWIVEALGSGVHVRRLEGLLAEESIAVVLRHPGLRPQQQAQITDYALEQAGARFNFVGVTLHVPFSLARRACEMPPLLPEAVRDVCVRSVGVLNYLAASETQLFCSQLVMQAYQHAGVQVTAADPRLITPADILHMREGDVPSVAVRQPLRFVGHLKYEPPSTVVAAVTR